MKKGLLLVNLGSPKSYDPQDVKSYLDEFLMDEYVIDLPYWLRVFIVRGIVLNMRPKKSGAAYKKIWWDEGSPLIVLTKRLQEKVQNYLDIPIEIAMRYGIPSIKEGIEKLYKQGVKDIVLLPLYPQYAMATTKTILVLAEQIRKEYFPDMKFRHIPAFYNQKAYIDILSKSIKEFLENKDINLLLFSYHGVPKRHIRKSDVTQEHCKIDGSCCFIPSKAHRFCYRHQCYNTTNQVVKTLGMNKENTMTTFQSRLGVDPWLQPYTDQTIADLPSNGIKKIAVVMPAFVSDCLETLEEIGMEAKHSFLESGGQKFYTIPCLNNRDDWAKLIANWTKEMA